MRAIERRLRERIKALEQQNHELTHDRELFRDHFSRRFKWWIQLMGDSKTPSLSWLIEADAKELRNFTWWSW